MSVELDQVWFSSRSNLSQIEYICEPRCWNKKIILNYNFFMNGCEFWFKTQKTNIVCTYATMNRPCDLHFKIGCPRTISQSISMSRLHIVNIYWWDPHHPNFPSWKKKVGVWTKVLPYSHVVHWVNCNPNPPWWEGGLDSTIPTTCNSVFDS